MKRRYAQIRPIQKGLGLLGLVCLCSAAVAAVPFDLQFPTQAEVTAQRTEPRASVQMPIGRFQNGSLPSTPAEGQLEQTAWRLKLGEMTTMALWDGLRAQIAGAGFTVIFECQTETCGGFDFRYAADVMAEPDMHVDLGDFRYLAAERGSGADKEYLNLLVSRSPQDGFVQLTRIGALPVPAADLTASTKTPGRQPAAPLSLSEAPAPVASDLVSAALDAGAPLVLEDLAFASGSAGLQPGEYASLAALAAWLQAHPQASVLLVGHTDASGGQSANQAISERRAESVRQVLIQQFDIPARQVTAAGAGMLAPRFSNLDEAGRTKNRRVEVFATPTR